MNNKDLSAWTVDDSGLKAEGNSSSQTIANAMLAAGISIIGFVKQDSPEWNYMWSELARDELNKDNEDPVSCENFGECWEYMDTSWYGDKIQHCFRHRMHQKLYDSRHYIKVPASSNFNPETDCE